jgi:hypothetical protein
MSYKSEKNVTSRWGNLKYTPKNQTAKNQTKICNLGVNGTMRPCCDKNIHGEQCHIKPALLDHRKRLTRGDTKQMESEYDSYKKRVHCSVPVVQYQQRMIYLENIFCMDWM